VQALSEWFNGQVDGLGARRVTKRAIYPLATLLSMMCTRKLRGAIEGEHAVEPREIMVVGGVDNTRLLISTT